MDNKDNNQLNLDLKPEVARGQYSNLAVISHSPSEFIIDFATMLPGVPKPEITNRIVMAPEHCKRLMNALADNISKYESIFGEISLERNPNKGATLNLCDFNPNAAKS